MNQILSAALVADGRERQAVVLGLDHLVLQSDRRKLAVAMTLEQLEARPAGTTERPHSTHPYVPMSGQGDGAGEGDIRNRVDLAEDRTVLAMERTFAAWLRTGLAALAVGIGFERIFPDIQPMWLPKAGATLLVVLALAIFGFGLRRYLLTRQQLHRHAVPRMPLVGPALFAILAAGACAAAALVFWNP